MISPSISIICYPIVSPKAQFNRSPTADSEIRNLLEAAYQDFHSAYYREKDPVSLAHRYAEGRDREVAGFLCALLSYGNVRTILSNASWVLDRLGPSPYEAVKKQSFLGRFASFRHRFTTGEDLEILCYWLSLALKKSGSLENFFMESALNPERKHPLQERLSAFVQQLSSQTLPKKLEQIAKGRVRSLRYLLSDPSRGSACKRLNLFLRWMVRSADGIDLGLWSRLHPRELILPVDTHLLQTLRLLQWTSAQVATWRVAMEATQKLRLYHPEDPIRYDFALCHLSMTGKSIAMYRDRS